MMRQLVKDTNKSKLKLEREMYLAEVKERKEQVRLEETKIRENIERHKRMKESQSKALKILRLEQEKEAT